MEVKGDTELCLDPSPFIVHYQIYTYIYIYIYVYIYRQVLITIYIYIYIYIYMYVYNFGGVSFILIKVSLDLRGLCL